MLNTLSRIEFQSRSFHRTRIGPITGPSQPQWILGIGLPGSCSSIRVTLLWASGGKGEFCHLLISGYRTMVSVTVEAKRDASMT